MTELEKAYLAGLLDGEGSVGINNQFYLFLHVANSDRAVLEWVCSVSGVGNIYEEGRRRANHSSMYCYQTNGLKASNLLSMLLPYLKIKVKHARLAISFIKHGFPRGIRPKHKIPVDVLGKRMKYYNAMKLLNRRGTKGSEISKILHWD